MRVTVNVTKTCIKKGQPHEACRCPIALAISRLLRAGVDAFVEEDSVSIYTDDSGRCSYSVPLPNAAQKFIFAFDEGALVEPFTFTLEVHKDVLRPSVVKAATGGTK